MDISTGDLALASCPLNSPHLHLFRIYLFSIYSVYSLQQLHDVIPPLKLRLLDVHVMSVMTYSALSWTTTTEIEKKIETQVKIDGAADRYKLTTKIGLTTEILKNKDDSS